MADVPQQDWLFYEAQTQADHVAWVRGLSPQDRFALYEDLFNLVWSARDDRGDWRRLERWHWDQKVATRLRLCDAFSKLDHIDRE
jgi:hypothetical protein